MARSRLKLASVLHHMQAKPAEAAPAAAKPGKPVARNVGGGRNEVRIIGGQWKRRRLAVSAAPGLRPTADRVRETLFNWLAHQAGGDLEGWRCLDAFAGTGALGLEAASRGATQVSLVETSSEALEHLRQAVQLLQAGNVRVVAGDGLGALRQQAAGSLNLVFLDPPYTSTVYEAALKAAHAALAPKGLVYLEAGLAWHAEALAEQGFAALRYLKAGQVHAHLLQRVQDQETPSTPSDQG